MGNPRRTCARLRNSLFGILLFCGSLGYALPARGPAPIVLRHRFQPGIEMAYDFVTALDQELSLSGKEVAFEMGMQGLLRQIVAEADAKSGVALIGQLAAAEWQRREGGAGAPATSKEQTWNSAWRVDAAGRSLPRGIDANGAAQNALQRTAGQIGENAQPCAAFPRQAVRAGSSWSGPVLLPLPGMRVRANAVSTLTAIREEDGATCGVIRSVVGADSVQAQTEWMPEGWLPDMVVTGTSTAVLAIEQGVWRSVEWDLRGELGGVGFEGEMRLSSRLTLKSLRQLPPADAAAWSARIKAFDGAIGLLFTEPDAKKAVARLGEIKHTEQNEHWYQGLELTIAMVDPAHRVGSLVGFGTGGEERRTGPADARLEEADAAAMAGDWRKAADAYQAVARDFPGEEQAVQALAAAAAICEERLALPAVAADLRRQVVEHREKAVASAGGVDKRIALYRLGAARTEAGDISGAANAYEQFLCATDGDAPANLRLLAQYRAARLREQLGQRERALAAYRAALATPLNDAYSQRLKAIVAARLQALAQRPAAAEQDEK